MILRRIILVIGVLLVGCAGSTGLANPASTYCAEQGGTVEIRDEAGGQAGYCLFADGSECEEFAFMNGKCKPGDSLKDY